MSYWTNTWALIQLQLRSTFSSSPWFFSVNNSKIIQMRTTVCGSLGTRIYQVLWNHEPCSLMTRLLWVCCVLCRLSSTGQETSRDTQLATIAWVKINFQGPWPSLAQSSKDGSATPWPLGVQCTLWLGTDFPGSALPPEHGSKLRALEEMKTSWSKS